MLNIIPTINKDSAIPARQQPKKEVEVQRVIPKPKDSDDIPEGYLTNEEFWKICRENVDKRCREYGILE